jgi:hypothetical protein
MSITVQGSFEVSNTCNKEFNRMVQTFGMTAEYARLKGSVRNQGLSVQEKAKLQKVMPASFATAPNNQ